VLESIRLLSGSLSQTKHGQKVLTKLSKAYPHIFVGAPTGSNTKPNNAICNDKVSTVGG